ncbi:MAG: VOC family protein [Ktedonobacteraceae bacterium]|nr:VOC family protein [Ktedonobacteraceae bacterium]
MVAETAQFLEKTSDPLAEARIVYLILYVNDLAESKAFYERQLGLRVIEADESSAKFDTGQVILCLNRATDYGVTLSARRDDASDVVFLVDDINAMRQALEDRGVVFVRRRTYEIGLVTDFYDPNGHRLMIYQPSQEALSWRSGEKIRKVWSVCGKGGSDLIGPAAVPLPENGTERAQAGLDGKPLIYLFMFVPDSNDALAYYKGALGLQEVERVHCCNPACPPEELGVAKYDGGGMLLTTHHVHKTFVVDDFGKVYSPQTVDPAHTKGIVPVFRVANIGSIVERLAHRGINFSDGVVRSQIGDIAKFQATTGHTFYLYEPSTEALKWPSGTKIEQILATSR